MIDAQLHQTGRYRLEVTPPPDDDMYHRSQWWLVNKGRNLRRQHDELDAVEMAECTFHPNLERSAAPSSQRCGEEGDPQD